MCEHHPSFSRSEENGIFLFWSCRFSRDGFQKGNPPTWACALWFFVYECCPQAPPPSLLKVANMLLDDFVLVHCCLSDETFEKLRLSSYIFNFQFFPTTKR